MQTRYLSLIGFLTCAFLLGLAYYFQYGRGMEPCPLCIFQRLAFFGLALTFLVSAIRNASGLELKFYNVLGFASGLFGVAIAARHVWLQNLPADQVPECGPGLEFMWQAFPFQKFLETVLKGSGECAEVSWSMLGLTMPGWSLVWLVILTALTLFLLFRRHS